MPERKDRPYFSVEQAEKEFPNQWILMDVKETDEHGRSIAGEIIYHSRRRSAWKHLGEVISGRSLGELQQEGRKFYVFAGEKQPAPDPDKALARYIRFTNQLAKEAL